MKRKNLDTVVSALYSISMISISKFSYAIQEKEKNHTSPVAVIFSNFFFPSALNISPDHYLIIFGRLRKLSKQIELSPAAFFNEHE